MNARPLRDPGETRRYLGSWAFSLLLHGAAVGAAIALVADLRLAPQPEPFKWEISLVQAPAPEPEQAPASADVAPASPTLASTEPHAVEAPPVAQPAPTVQPTRQLVRQQEASAQPRESRPVPQAAAAQQPQASSQAAQTSPPTQTVAMASDPTVPAPEDTSVIRESLPSSESSPVMRENAAPVPQPLLANVRPPSPAEPAADSRPAAVATRAPALAQEPEAMPDASDSVADPAPVELAVANALKTLSTPSSKSDYGWLAEALWSRVEQLKRYPFQARMNRWEGRVVLRVVVRADGQIIDPTVAESSGHSLLDHDALEILRQASPLKLTHPLGKPQVVVQVPISYRLAH